MREKSIPKKVDEQLNYVNQHDGRLYRCFSFPYKSSLGDFVPETRHFIKKVYQLKSSLQYFIFTPY